jgi:hypothetical protein
MMNIWDSLLSGKGLRIIGMTLTAIGLGATIVGEITGKGNPLEMSNDSKDLLQGGTYDIQEV